MDWAYQINGVANLSQVGGSERRKCTSQRVAGGDDFVTWICGTSTINCALYLRLDAVPRVKPASMCEASVTDRPRDQNKVQVRDEVSNTPRTSERYDNQFVRMVQSHEASSIGDPDTI